MDDQHSPWDDINPPMASAPQPGRQIASSTSLLSPATNTEFRDELTACLSLVAPVGMAEEARAEWLAVAWSTLGHLPADLLAIGAQKARETCDHPSKIVPAILGETRDMLDRRRYHFRETVATVPTSHRLPEPDICTPEQADAILREFGLRRNPLDLW